MPINFSKFLLNTLIAITTVLCSCSINHHAPVGDPVSTVDSQDNNDRYCLSLDDHNYCLDEKFPGAFASLENVGSFKDDIIIYRTNKNFHCPVSISVYVRSDKTIVSIFYGLIWDSNQPDCDIPAMENLPTSGRFVVIKKPSRLIITDKSSAHYFLSKQKSPD